MTVIPTRRLVMPSDFLQVPEEPGYELVEGDLLVRDMSIRSSWIAGNLVRLIGNHAEDGRLGWVFPPDLGCQCFADAPSLVRRPDLSFVRADRFSADEIGDGYLRIVPDLIVEVVSPNDLAKDVGDVIALFRKAGVPLIWAIYPDSRNIHVVRADGSGAVLGEGDQLSGEGIIPGFACPVASIFPPMAATPPV